MNIESQKTNVKASVSEVYTFLADASNIEHLLPKDNVSDFQATDTECSFKVQGGITITLVQKKLNPNHSIEMESGEKSPFPFNLTVFIEENGEGATGYLVFDGKVNSFLSMMVKKPLTNLFDYMSNKLENQFG